MSDPIIMSQRSGFTSVMDEMHKRDALIRDLLAALKLARTRMAHSGGSDPETRCYAFNPTEEWAEKGSMNYDNCQCEIAIVDAAIAKAEGRAS